MQRIFERVGESFFSKDIPLRGRLINICLFLCTIGGVLGAIATFIQASSVIAVVSIMLLPISTIILQIWVGKTGNYRAGGFIFSIVLCDIIFPIIFFSSGGIRSGMLAYFMLGSVILFLLLGDNTGDCVFMTIVFLTVNSLCILYSHYNPAIVTHIQSEAMLYLDVIVAFIVSAVLVEMALWFQNRLYKNEQKRAEEAMKAKDEFLASMSHELRTPLNAIIGLSEIQMKMKKDLPKSSYEDIKHIYESGTTLLRIINDILDISKIGSGRFELICTEYSTVDMVNDAISMNKVRIGDKPINFEVSIDPSLPSMLFGDELRVRQILNNILSNAFKYTHSGTVSMAVSGKVSAAGMVFMQTKITDTGIGIRREDIPLLFGKYNKLDNAKNHNIEGTGLGLSITRELLHMMGGKIMVDSDYGKGSTFSFEVPQKIIDKTPIGEEKANSLADFTYKDNKSKQHEFAYTDLSGMRVLVVDDVDINLYVTSEMLAPYKMEVDCVESGREVVDLVKKANPEYDIIFMDHMMPGIDGVEATRIIREEIGTDYAKTVPIVALTANALVGNEELFLNSGFQAFLTKPMDLLKLDETMKKLLKK